MSSRESRVDYLESQIKEWEERGYSDEKIKPLRERLRFLKQRR